MIPIRALAIAVLAAGCEFGHSIRREVPAPASEACIKVSLASVPDISDVRAERKEGRRPVFYWVAKRQDEWTSGFVTTDAAGVVLETGHMNGHPCDGIAYGKTILDAILSQIRQCSVIPDHVVIREECLGIGTCECR